MSIRNTCLVAVFAVACSTHSPEVDAPAEETVLSDITPEPETVVQVPELVIPCCAAPPAAEPVSLPVRVVARTDVQQAPGFYSACLSELPHERQSCRSRFNRRWTESTIIRRQGDPGGHLMNMTRLVLGRIILSEANWVHVDRLDSSPDSNRAEVDAAAIYQVLRYTRRSGQTLLGTMREHSPHVSEARPILTHRRMAWIVRLQLNCNEPHGFPQTDAHGNRLNWHRDYRPRCEVLFEHAQKLLDGDAEALGPWTSAPLRTWGGRCEDAAGACDDSLASHRGLVPFDTGATANRFWCRPSDAGCDGPPLVIVQP